MGRSWRSLTDKSTEVDGKYDVVLIDCPPSLDQLTINALTAADALLVVTEPGQYALNGLDRLLDTIEIVREYTNPSLIVAGVVINGYKYTRRMDRWAPTFAARSARSASRCWIRRFTN